MSRITAKFTSRSFLASSELLKLSKATHPKPPFFHFSPLFRRIHLNLPALRWALAALGSISHPTMILVKAGSSSGFLCRTFESSDLLTLGIQIPSKKVVWSVFRRLNTFSEGSWIPWVRKTRLSSIAQPYDFLAVQLASPLARSAHYEPGVGLTTGDCHPWCFSGKPLVGFLRGTVFVGKAACF